MKISRETFNRFAHMTTFVPKGLEKRHTGRDVNYDILRGASMCNVPKAWRVPTLRLG